MNLRSQRIYRLLLRAYPRNFYDSYGEDLLQLFRDQLRDAIAEQRVSRFWFRIIMDLASTLPTAYLETMKEQANESRRHFVSARTKSAFGLAILCALAGAYVTKQPAGNFSYGGALDWPLSLISFVACRMALDACATLFAFVVFLLAAGQLTARNIFRGSVFCVAVVVIGRGADYLAYVFLPLPPYGLPHAAVYMLQWLPMLIAVSFAARFTMKSHHVPFSTRTP
jgi:hypothetical protein